MKNKYVLILLLVVCVFLFTGCNKKDNKLKEGKDYNINGETTCRSKERGYYVDTLNKPNSPYLYFICMGEKSSGGFTLEVKEVNKVDDSVEVIVEEIIPGKDQMVTMAFTRPGVIVEFPKYQEKIIIKNTKGEIFDYIK